MLTFKKGEQPQVHMDKEWNNIGITLKAFTAAILLKVVNIFLHLARLSLKLADMIFKVLVLNAQV